jgi:hypothetical protein
MTSQYMKEETQQAGTRTSARKTRLGTWQIKVNIRLPNRLSRHLLLQHDQTWSARGQIQTALNARCGKAIFFLGKHFQQFKNLFYKSKPLSKSPPEGGDFVL